MSHTKHPATSILAGTGMLVLLLFALISCGTNAASGDSGAETTVETESETTISTPLEETTEIASSEDGIFFPQQRAGVDYPMAENRGKLTIDDEGCIRLDEYDDDQSPTLLWPASFSLSASDDDIAILDQRDRLAGRVGERVRIGGGGVPGDYLDENTLKDDKALELLERCPGRYWLVAES